MNSIISSTSDFSTTRLITSDKPNIISSPQDKFGTILFLPEGEGRRGEGGLRTKGYFKKSYDGKPLISIITVVYNGEKFLEETINSVINQTYDNVEYIIIDGGSTDGTVDIIKKYEDRIDYWVSERDKGIYDAMNKAVKLSIGDWISFLGADDFYLEDSIQNYVISLQKSTEFVDYISSNVELISSSKLKNKMIGSKWEWKKFKKYMNVAHVGSLHNIKFFKENGLFNTSYKIAADYEILLRKKNNLKSLYVKALTAKMRDGGVSNQQKSLTLKETRDAKISTANRSKIIAYYEYYFALFKIFLKSYL